MAETGTFALAGDGLLGLGLAAGLRAVVGDERTLTGVFFLLAGGGRCALAHAGAGVELSAFAQRVRALGCLGHGCPRLLILLRLPA
mgnify:CR=1 FL=1